MNRNSNVSLGLADIFGVREKKIKWERPLFFIFALFLSDLFRLILKQIIEHSNKHNNYFSYFLLPEQWIFTMVSAIIIVSLSLFFFKIIPHTWINLIVIVILYPLLLELFHFGFYKLNFSLFPDNKYIFPYFDLKFIQNNIVSHMKWALFFLGMMAIFLYLLRKLFLGIFLGALIGEILHYLLQFNFHTYFKHISFLVYYLRSNVYFLSIKLFRMAIFALVLWALLRLISPPTSFSTMKRERLSKSFFMGTTIVANMISLIIFLAIFVFFIFRVWAVGERYAEKIKIDQLLSVICLFSFGILFGILTAVVSCVFIYRMWAAIQDGHARTTPGRAVGFLFIPLYSLYWGFVVFCGFAIDYNNYLKRHEINARPLSSGIFQTYMILCILACILAFVPFITLLTLIPIFIVWVIMVSRICQAVNMLPFPEEKKVDNID